jgi:hypothetical protein
MNMDNNPMIEELSELIRACNDRAGHHILWVAKNGDVHVTRLPRDNATLEFEETHPDLRLRYETFEAGNEYVGAEAAEDDGWISELFAVLTREWPKAKAQAKPTVEYIDQA